MTKTATKIIEASVTRRVLEDLTDRVCRNDAIKYGVPKTLSGFTDWLRGLFPELYVSFMDNELGRNND